MKLHLKWGLISLMLAAPQTRPRVSSWDFNQDKLDKEPDAFYFDETGRAPSGKWRVIQDGDDRVLAQLDTNREKSRFTLGVVRDSNLKDLKLSARIKSISGQTAAGGGIVWRYRNSENYLLARLDLREQDVRLFRVVDGNRVKFGDKDDLKLKAKEWYTLRIEHRGKKIRVFLDDEFLFEESDRHFTKSGKVGFWTQADAVTHFDDLRATDLDDDDDDDR